MKRNPDAKCGTCPYWHQNPKSTCGNCQAVSWTCIEKLDTEWCGQHPHFWEAETEAEPDVTNCESPALEEIARLLNEGEDAEALKEFRRMHGLINQFVCTNCGNISSSTGHGFACRECGGELTARVVIEQEEDTQW